MTAFLEPHLVRNFFLISFLSKQLSSIRQNFGFVIQFTRTGPFIPETLHSTAEFFDQRTEFLFVHLVHVSRHEAIMAPPRSFTQKKRPLHLRM